MTGLTAARQVADAVLYEGYLLYPYRASSAKNQVRWQFGVLGPDGAAEAGSGEPTTMSSEVVLECGAGASVDVLLRFLQVQARVVERRVGDGWEPVPELLVAGTRWVPFHEAVPRELPLLGAPLDRDTRHEVLIPGGRDVEELRDGGEVVGRLVRTRWELTGTVVTRPGPGRDPRLAVLRLEVTNTTGLGTDEGWAARDVAARYSLVGTHLLLTASGSRFLSLLDGPGWADADTRDRAQHRCWPVLVTADDGSDAVLVAPIILGDHPTVAPESAGDLFDATEIDEILTLRVMTMTDREKAEARGTDPRAAAILERCDGMADSGLELLHGARRDPVVTDAPPWWDAEQEALARPESDQVEVGGVAVRQGSRVLLRPSRRADAQDIFLAGLTAVVSRVCFDVDGGTHVAVVLEDDPAADLYGSTGRFYYFGPEEIEPLQEREDAR